MNPRRIIALMFALVSAWSADAAIAARPPDLLPLQLAAAARREAEADLSNARQQHLAERAELLAQLQRGAVEVQSRTAELLAERRQLAELTGQAEALRAQQSRQAERESRRAERALLAVGEQPPAGSTAAAMAETAIAALSARIEALAMNCRMRQAVETVVARDGSPRSAPVLRLGGAQAIALGPTSADRGLLRPGSDGGLPQVAGPQLQIAPGHVVIDPAGRGFAATDVTWTLSAWLEAGRLFIWPILAVLAIGSGLGLFQLRTLLRERTPGPLPRAWDEAPPATFAMRDDCAGMLRDAAWTLRHAARPEREAAMETRLVHAESHLHRHLALILVLAGVAPLLGLLGTVTGMIDLFASLSGGADAAGISGAISEALVTTQAGMIAAIPLMLGHALLYRLASRRCSALEADALSLVAIPAASAPGSSAA